MENKDINVMSSASSVCEIEEDEEFVPHNPLHRPEVHYTKARQSKQKGVEQMANS